MLSLLLPYWNRQEAANRAFALLDKHYRGLDMEVIVIDDGNKVPFVVPDTKLNVRVVRLPEKDKPNALSKAWNAGVKAAKGEIILLSCIEVLHEKPVIEQLVKGLGENDYALAAAWCPESIEWHTHSTRLVPSCPDGTGLSFLGALHKSLYEKSGGFDEDYHEGAGYEDRDFIWRMTEAGANFIMRDDLVVVHPKTGASIAWGEERFARNEALYMQKWAHRMKPINIVCLKAGTAYGAEYVNILFDMVRRNLKGGYPGAFHCITDNPEGLDPSIRVIPLPDDLETWWGKLYMFKRGLFEDGSRMLFMDLDTLVIGSLNELVKYDGQFATLRDFFHPQRVGPAIIAWKAGEFSASIWDEWKAAGKPRNPMGDLWWINELDQGRFIKKIDILQDVYPGMFCSFKADCKPYPPKGARIVCFHGQPKPSNCGAEWVENVWKVGGGCATELEAIANTELKHVMDNVDYARNLGLPELKFYQPHEGHAVIVAGGPSIKKSIEEVKWRKSIGQFVIACNGAARFLNEHGIKPDAQIVIDARKENKRFIADSRKYWLASQCDRALFRKAGKRNTMIFNMNTEGMKEHLPNGTLLISSGTTVGLAAMVVAYTAGYRNIHLYGIDSSYEETHHAYQQPENDADAVIEAIVDGTRYKCAPWMVVQAQQFQDIARQLAEEGVTLTVNGDGLLPHVARLMVV